MLFKGVELPAGFRYNPRVKSFFHGILVLALLATKAWAMDLSTNFVGCMIQINGHPARMIFASSLGSSLVLEDGANRLGFTGDPYSKSTEMESGGKKFSVPIFVFGDPLKKVPWVLRQAVKVTHLTLPDPEHI